MKSWQREVKLIKKDIVNVLKSHIDRLKKMGYDIYEINDILEEVFDGLEYEYGDLIASAMCRV
jgi:DNA-binding transcriptional regulator YhcF (GntR family)